MGRHAKHRRAERDTQQQPVPARPVLFYDVVLWRHDDEPVLSWAAEGGITGDRSGLSFESTNQLSKLVAEAVTEVRRISLARGGAVIGVHWLVADNLENPEAAKRMAREVAVAEGVELPARVSSRDHVHAVLEVPGLSGLSVGWMRGGWRGRWRASRRGTEAAGALDRDCRHAPSMG